MRKSKHNRHGNSVSRKIVFSVAFILFALYALLILFFFVYAILISLKLNQDTFLDDQFNYNLFSIPTPPNFGNYVQAFTEWTNVDGEHTFMDMLWNSIWRTTSSSFLTWFTTAIVCYVLVHYRSKFTHFLYTLGLLGFDQQSAHYPCQHNAVRLLFLLHVCVLERNIPFLRGGGVDRRGESLSDFIPDNAAAGIAEYNRSVCNAVYYGME